VHLEPLKEVVFKAEDSVFQVSGIFGLDQLLNQVLRGEGLVLRVEVAVDWPVLPLGQHDGHAVLLLLLLPLFVIFLVLNFE